LFRNGGKGVDAEPAAGASPNRRAEDVAARV
jgi:hypothetical protein